MKQSPIGKYASLKVVRFSEIGAWLDYESEGILLPAKEVPLGTKIDDTLKVFVYKDSKNRLTASLQTPTLTLDHYGKVFIADTNQYGAFADWGIPNQLLIPFREQVRPLHRGETIVIRLYLDTKTDRLVGSTYIEKTLQKAPADLKPNSALEAIVYEKTKMGYKLILNQTWKGLIFHSDIYQQISIGDLLTVYVLNVREDGKVDVRLRPEGLPRIQGASQDLIHILKRQKGFLPIHDKSSPEKISDYTGMSKKTFKRAVGMLLKEKIIEQNEQGIFLLR